MITPHSIILKTQGQEIKITAISTGQVAVAQRFKEARFSGLFAKLDFLMDSSFTEFMPIWIWVIEHPEGLFIIDTGETADINRPDYFDPAGFFMKWVNTKRFKFKVNTSEEIRNQLANLSIDYQSATIIITHLHADHIDGLHYFEHNPVIMNKLEWEKPFGHLPHLIPKWLNPTLIECNHTYKHFQKVQFLTPQQDLMLVATPGHTHGHSSVLLKTDSGYIFFAGDVSYNQQQLIDNKFSGVLTSNKVAKNTFETIKAFAKDNKTVYLPSHDDNAIERLKNLTFL